jgi:hypothetical protein
MSGISRRSFVSTCCGAVAASQVWSSGFGAEEADRSAFPPKVLGTVAPRSSIAIAASPLSVGFETLDRKMFDPERTYPHLARLGVKWARAQTGWARTERTRGQYDFGWLDSVVDSLRNIGVQPWFNLGYGNRLYTPDAPDDSAVGWAPLNSDEAKRGWVAYTQRIADHFRDRVTHWEIWNEPNIRGFWKPKQPAPADYLELVRITVPEIRRRVPGAVIVGGALAGMPREYLEGCMKLGLGDWVDKISYHPYRAVPEANYEPEVRAWRELLARYKRGIEIWQGENGCPSQAGSTGALRQYDWNETRQAKWLLRRILTDLRLEIELTSYFHLVDLVNYNWGSGPSGKTNFKGLLRGTDYTPKPSYFAYQCLCALFDAETKRADLRMDLKPAPDETGPLDADETHQAGFVRAGHALYAYWRPADLQQDVAMRRVSVALHAGPGAEIRTPVLIDPLTRKVHAIRARREGDRTWQIDSLPLADYPLIVTDRAVAGSDAETGRKPGP